MDRKTKTLRDRVLEHLAILRIPISAEELDHVLEAVDREHLSVLAAFDRLLGEQAARRRDRAIKRRVIAAKFAEHKTLEAFDWTFNKAINRTQYEQLATGDFIRRHINVILVGQSGVGKSHLMQAVGLSACAVGYRVFYTTSAGLLRRLTAALADKSLTDTLRWYANWDLLVIDEFGLDQIEREECPNAAHLLYKVIVSRHHKRSTILITNIDFDAWAQYLGDAPLATAMLDRLVDGAVVIKIKGPSYRASRSGSPLASPPPS
jgi:DNA replication protein DnaC